MRSTHAVLPLFLLLSGLPGVSRAEIPEPDQAFLDEAIPPLRQITDRVLGGPQNQVGALSGIREILAERRKTLQELQQLRSLTDLIGIETEDQYDALALTSVRRVAAAGAASDTTHPSPDAVRSIEAVFQTFPDLGKAPIAFMVLGYSELALAAGDSLVAKGSPPALIDHVVLGHIVAATDLAVREGDDFFGNSAAQSLRQDMVVVRLRCPKDQSIYKMNAMKNQIHEEGNISTLYYLQCTKCGEPRLIEFPQELASRLNRMAERQKQAKPGLPARSQTLEP